MTDTIQTGTGLPTVIIRWKWMLLDWNLPLDNPKHARVWLEIERVEA